jgi:hypothetical protein
MKRAIAFLACLLVIGCSQSPVAPIERHAVRITADISRDYNPWKDLYIIVPVDSVIRAYNSDTMDIITVDHGAAIALLYYRDGIRERPAWDTLIVTSDTNVYFNNRIMYF